MFFFFLAIANNNDKKKIRVSQMAMEWVGVNGSALLFALIMNATRKKKNGFKMPFWELSFSTLSGRHPFIAFFSRLMLCAYFLFFLVKRLHEVKVRKLSGRIRRRKKEHTHVLNSNKTRSWLTIQVLSLSVAKECAAASFFSALFSL